MESSPLKIGQIPIKSFLNQPIQRICLYSAGLTFNEQTMKRLFVLLAITLTISFGAQAQFTNTLTITGASWNDGGSLNGYLTIGFDGSGTPISLISADITTGNSSPGYYSGGQTFYGCDYLYNVSGQADTIGFWTVDIVEGVGGAPANEINLSLMSFPFNYVNLDWQGSASMTLFSGVTDGSYNEYSAENYITVPDGHYRYLSPDGGSVGVVPEPGTCILLGFGVTCLPLFRRRK